MAPVFFRSSMLLSSTAKTATRTLTASPSYIYSPIFQRTISSTRSYLSNQNQSTPSPSTITEMTTPSSVTDSQPLPQEENETIADSESLPQETEAAAESRPFTLLQAAANLTNPPSLRKYPYTLKTGTVTSVGLMNKTVRVAYRHTEWDRHIRKPYPKTTTYLVADPRNSLREGDVIEFSSGAPRSRHVRHVVERIIAPFGEDISARPPVMTREEREAERMLKRAEKLARKASRIAEKAASTDGGNDDDAEAIARRFLQSKDHMGRIRSLVLERTAASS